MSSQYFGDTEFAPQLGKTRPMNLRRKSSYFFGPNLDIEVGEETNRYRFRKMWQGNFQARHSKTQADSKPWTRPKQAAPSSGTDKHISRTVQIFPARTQLIRTRVKVRASLCGYAKRGKTYTEQSHRLTFDRDRIDPCIDSFTSPISPWVPRTRCVIPNHGRHSTSIKISVSSSNSIVR